MSKFWKWNDSVDSKNSELILEGPISDMTWWGDEVTPQEFRDELAKHAGDITVVLNSGGGDVFAGMSIYDALRQHDGYVTLRVSGLAASIASVIAMAADKIIMAPGSMMMIHKPWTMVVGDTNDLDKTKEILQGIEDSIIPIYAARTGLSKEDIADLLEAETWMTAEQAVEKGFADEATQAKEKVTVSDAIKNALNGEFAFSMSAAKKSLEEFVNKVKAESEKEVEEETKVEPVEVIAEVVPEVVIPEETEVKVEAEVEEEEIKSTEEEETVENKEIAQDQVIEPKNQAPVAPKVEVKDYLKTKASMEAFARILEEQAGKTSEDVKDAWKNHLEVQLGVSNPEVFLPEALITEITDAFKAGGEIWNRVTKTGSEVFRAAWDTVTGEDSRAKGYDRATQAEKAEELITIADRVLRPQFIYKYITLNREDVKNQRSTGALVQYVLSELPRRIIREVERAIVIGDGRVDGSDYKIDSFVAVKADATAGNVFATTYTPEVGESKYSALLHARDLVEADGAQVLVCKKGYLTDLLLEQGVNGGFMFAPGTNVGALLGFAAVIEPDWMTEDADNDAYILAAANYKTVGDLSIESFTNFILKTNKQEYLQEIYAGGGLTVRKSAAAIAVVTS